MSAFNLAVFTNRMTRAAVLDRNVYEEIEADGTAWRESAAVVVLSSVAAGIGAGGALGSSAATFVWFTAIALVAWISWALLIAQIGGHVMPGPRTRTSFGELARTIGFAATPGVLQVFGAMPRMMLPVFAFTAVWSLAAMVVAVRQALDYETTGRALVVCGLAWLLVVTMAVAIVWFGPAVS